jgi:flagella basal body P-ring formation protein FlgA
MMFGLANSKNLGKAAIRAALTLFLAISSATAAFAADYGVAVVPSTIIYPGQEIDAGQVRVVDVTNPNLTEGYARSVNEVQGMITTRTLLPGRTIMLSGLRKPFTVRRGDKAMLIYDNGTLRITASGTPLADANTGDLIRARNTDSGVIISGTVMADGTILVAQK